MKHLILCLSLLAALGARGQSILGISAGANLTSIEYTEYTGDAKSRMGFRSGLHLGGIAGNYFNEHWGILSGLAYEGKGYKEDSSKMRLHYLEVPLKLSYRMNVGENQVYINGGVYGAYGFKGKLSGVYDPSHSTDPFITEGYRRLDFGYVLEGMYIFSNNIGFSLSYSHGITNLANNEGNLQNFLFQGALVFLLKK